MTKKYTINLSSMWLFIIFLVLKLTHVIDWSWIWITSPLWIGAIIMVLALMFAGMIASVLLLALKNGKLTIKKDES